MKHQLTDHDIKKIKEEIEYRKVEKRKELLEHVKEARSHGDLSENFEYYAAKKEKNKNESRIRYLERMLKTCEVVEDNADQDTIGIYKTVELFFEEEGETETFSIVTTVLVDVAAQRISIESPMGKALMGHKVGDRVYIQVNPHYGYYIQVKSIQPFDDSNISLNEY